MKSFSALRVALFFGTALGVQAPVLAEADYPAAYFEPYIVYQAPEIAENASAGESSAAEESASEPAEESPYPAAYYEPVIVYQDQELIAAGEKRKAAESKPAPAPAKKAKPAPAPVVTDDGGFPMTVLFLLVAVIGAVYWAMTKNTGAAAEEEEAEASEDEEAMDEESVAETGEGEDKPAS